MSKLLLDQIRRKIDKATVISFDIFDTLLVRPYVAPTDVFVHMEKAYDRPGFANERRDAERRARIRLKDTDREDLTFDEIYENLAPKYHDLKQKELDWEAMILRANPELMQVYDYVRSQGKRIIITSDMYLPAVFLMSVLRKNGFDHWEKFYLSCEQGRKKNGSLYYKIIEELGVSPSDILHIGDNRRSDYNIAKMVGITPVLVRPVAEEYIEKNIKARSFWTENRDEFGASLLLSFFAYRWKEQCVGLRDSRNYWYDLGYCYTAPLVYGFCRYVETLAREEKIDNLLFIARSGKIMKSVFDALGSEIKSSYVYAPRSLKTICHLQLDYPEELPKLISFFCDKSEEIQRRYAQIDRNNSDSIKLFYDTNRKLFEKVAKQNLELYHRYISTVCHKDDHMMLVDDMASTFSAQQLIEEAVGKKIMGAYIVVYHQDKYNDVKRFQYANTYLKGNFRASETDVWTYKWRFVEMLMGAPEYPVEDISAHGVVYMQNPPPWEKFRARIAECMNDATMDFIHDIQALFCGHKLFLEYKTIIAWLNSYLLHPEKQDYAHMSKMSCDWKTFNSEALPFLVKPRRFSEYFIYKAKFPHGVNSHFFWPSINRCTLLSKREDKIGNKVIRFLGLPIYERIITPHKRKRKVLFGLIKSSKSKDVKEIRILGIKITKKIKQPIQSLKYHTIASIVQRAINIAQLHAKTFEGYKNKHQGQTVSLFGAGPTVNHYHPGLKSDVYVGANRACLLDSIKFDYLFSIDKAGLDFGEYNLYDQFFSYNCTKFIGDQNLGEKFQIPESVICRYDNIRRYKTTARHMANKIALDLESEPLGNFASVILQAMQFVMYTNPKCVYLIGIDCTNAEKTHFIGSAIDNSERGENAYRNDMTNILGWKRVKAFINTYYPETEIVSVNPVGLKGVFKDIYTRSFLLSHPEIDAKQVTILDVE